MRWTIHVWYFASKDFARLGLQLVYRHLEDQAADQYNEDDNCRAALEAEEEALVKVSVPCTVLMRND
jgi:hypothetical protein